MRKYLFSALLLALVAVVSCNRDKNLVQATVVDTGDLAAGGRCPPVRAAPPPRTPDTTASAEDNRRRQEQRRQARALEQQVEAIARLIEPTTVHRSTTSPFSMTSSPRIVMTRAPRSTAVPCGTSRSAVIVMRVSAGWKRAGVREPPARAESLRAESAPAESARCWPDATAKV